MTRNELVLCGYNLRAASVLLNSLQYRLPVYWAIQPYYATFLHVTAKKDTKFSPEEHTHTSKQVSGKKLVRCLELVT